MTGLFSHILGIIIPIDELIFFRGVETTNQISFINDSLSTLQAIPKIDLTDPQGSSWAVAD